MASLDSKKNVSVFNSRSLIAASLLMGLSAISASCGKSDDKTQAVEATVENDESKLAERMDTTQANIPLVNAEGQTNLALLDTFTALQVADLTPPTVDGVVVQANDLAISGTAVYVAYNYAGEKYAGGIDVLDITNVLSLKILSSLSLTGSDVNGIERNGTNLYAVGASSATNGAFLSRIALNGSLLTSTITQVALPSYAGTDIATTATSIYTTSGDTGGLQVFNLGTMASTKTTSIADARAVGVTAAGTPMVLSGKPGKVNVMTAAGDASTSFAIGGAATTESKSTLSIGSKWSVASLGEGGFKVFCNADGSQIAAVPQVTLSGIAPAKTVTNAVTSFNGLIYTANGEAGVYVYALRNAGSLSACGAGTVTLLGTLNFGAGFSANGVYSNGAFLYVATGLGGLKILTTVFTTLNPVSGNLL